MWLIWYKIFDENGELKGGGMVNHSFLFRHSALKKALELTNVSPNAQWVIAPITSSWPSFKKTDLDIRYDNGEYYGGFLK